LHSQFSNDVERLPANTARLAAYCNAKGRMLASFLYWKENDAYQLQLHHSLFAAIQKRLQMFVLRAKVKLIAAQDNLLLGLGGQAAQAALLPFFPDLPTAPYSLISNQHGTLIRVADGFGAPRYQLHLSAAQAEALWPALSQLGAIHPDIWKLADIQAGLACISATTQEKFVPQMVNYELVGGVNFKKGCYPGQEIVARSQYLGKLKRRMFIGVAATTAVNEGMEVFHQDGGEACGMIVNTVATAADSSTFLLELKLDYAERGNLHVGQADGASISLQSPPYDFADVTQ
jgi:folate-binding protein YgfZ